MMSINKDEIAELLREILKWIRFSSIGEVRTVLMSILETEQKRMIYHLSDGEHGSVEIGERTGVSHGTVTRYWDSWKRLGIVEPVRVRGGLRYRKLFELEDFGFSVPTAEITEGDEE
jgi:DNA-binding transcriptional ArsR family regulator